MKLVINGKSGVPIAPDMIGLFFEDINYAADGGLYAEMIENRSFEFMETEGGFGDFFTHYDGGYAWSPYIPAERNVQPESAGAQSSNARPCVRMRTVTGSPHTVENPHYLRLETSHSMCGIANQAYDGICLKKGMRYHVTFWARCVKFAGNFCIFIEKDGQKYASGQVYTAEGVEETYNYFRKYTLTISAEEELSGGVFALCLDVPGVVEFDYISMFPEDAVAGIFRRDLFEKLAELKPGFIRFPGGCIIEGNTLENRYRYKDGLKEPWARKNNWNRWAVHDNNEENQYHSIYSHYNQTYGLGFYEFFLLCELIGAKPLPVMNVGLACQYQTTELAAIDSPAFQEFVQDTLDLIEFANGQADTRWGAVRAGMGHPEPFELEMLGIGNEQWQTERVDFFERYILFEQAVHNCAPEIRLIGSAGPDITSERYEKAWNFYHVHENEENFAYAVDEHYYVKPQWLLDHTDFYDNYDRKVKVFSGEYAAHPVSGMNRYDANTLEGALAEAAFLTGVERNADVVVLASYAPLFARVGFAQWSPDLIWFDGADSYGTPSYYVQKMYANNIGDITLDTAGGEKEAAKHGIYYSLSYQNTSEEVILKIVNANEAAEKLELEWKTTSRTTYQAEILTGSDMKDFNSIEHPENVAPVSASGTLAEGITLPARSFAVIRMSGK